MSWLSLIWQDPAKFLCSNILDFVVDDVKEKMEKTLASAQELSWLVMGEMIISGRVFNYLKYRMWQQSTVL